MIAGSDTRRFCVRLRALIAAVAGALAAATAVAQDAPRRIAITFDDAPRSAGALMAAEQRTAMLIEALAAGGIDEAMFFVTTRNLERAGDAGAERDRKTHV